MPGELVLQSPAKVNLFLEVLGKRSDGFHELETVICGVSIYDTIHIQHRSDGQINICCSAPNLDDSVQSLLNSPKNLAWQAADRLRQFGDAIDSVLAPTYEFESEFL